jgi:small-conductance mechanosensitive channel
MSGEFHCDGLHHSSNIRLVSAAGHGSGTLLKSAPVHFVWLKNSWLQGPAERFSNYIDFLALRLSSHLGVWSREPLLFAITPSKALLVLAIFAIGLALAALSRILVSKRISTAGGRTPQFWRDGILFAFSKALSGFFILTGVFFASVPVLPHIGLMVGGAPPLEIFVKIAQVGYFAIVFGFCLRLALLVERWLIGLYNRQAAQWYSSALPVLGQALIYNVVLCAFAVTIYILDFPAPIGELAFKIVSIASIVANTTLLIRSVLAMESMVFSRSEMLHYDEYRKRRIQTRVQILRRLVVFIALILALAAILLNFEAVRQIGAGLLASAGVIGVIAGFAAQKSLSMMIAGLQIAFTQPIRIDDLVVVDGELGTIEEITLTYVVVRLWDQRRLIVPITYFLEKSFQNWTRSSSDLTGVVFFYGDFQISIDELRTEAERIVNASNLWDKRVFALQVTDFRSDCVEIRVMASAASAKDLFGLRCEIREEILRYLQRRCPDAFPKVRGSFLRIPVPGGDES